MRRKRGEADSFSVSFLDVAACGFGAMIILLMITKSGEPISIEFVDSPPEGAIIELQEQLFAIRGETTIFNRDLNAKQEQLSAMKDRIARLQRDLDDAKGRFQTSNQLSTEITDESGPPRYSPAEHDRRDAAPAREQQRPGKQRGRRGAGGQRIHYLRDRHLGKYVSATPGTRCSV